MLSPGALVASRYRVEAMVGRGGAATVYRVLHVALGVPLALKVLDLPATRQRFIREGQILAQLRHPHIVRVHDFVHLDGHPGLLMEFVPSDLQRRLLSGPPPVDEVLRLGGQIIEAVAAAHDIVWPWRCLLLITLARPRHA